MKKLVLVPFFFLFAAAAAYAQDNNDNNDQKWEYCRVIVDNKLFSKKIIVRFEFGEGSEMPKKTDAKKFTKTTDALDFLGSEGWKLIATPILRGEGGVTYYYILRRQKVK